MLANTILENAVSGTAVVGLRLQAVDENDTDVSSAVRWGLLQGSTTFAINSLGVITYASPVWNDGISPSAEVVVQAVADATGWACNRYIGNNDRSCL